MRVKFDDYFNDDKMQIQISLDRDDRKVIRFTICEMDEKGEAFESEFNLQKYDADLFIETFKLLSDQI